MALTDTRLKNAQPKEKVYRLSDAKGLYTEIQPNGSKYWRLKCRFAGKEKRLAIGVYPRVSIKVARKACDHAKDQLEQGIDPSQAKKAKKIEQAQDQANNLEAIAREWHQQQALKWSASYTEKVLRAIERDLFPYVCTLPLDQITPPKLLTVLRRVESRGAAESAHRLKQTTGQIFRYAVATGRAQRDITPDLKGALVAPKKQHFPAITEPAQVGRLLNMLDSYEGTATVRAAIQLA